MRREALDKNRTKVGSLESQVTVKHKTPPTPVPETHIRNVPLKVGCVCPSSSYERFIPLSSVSVSVPFLSLCACVCLSVYLCLYICLCVSVYTYICVLCMFVPSEVRGQQRALDLPELELHVVVQCSTWNAGSQAQVLYKNC